MSFLDDIGFKPTFGNPGGVLGEGNPLTGSSGTSHKDEDATTDTQAAKTQTGSELGTSISSSIGSSASQNQGQQVTSGSSNASQKNQSQTGSAATTQAAGTTAETQQSGISKEGLVYLLQSILGSTNGLASVASGQKTAGLYDSATNQLLVNDLLARAAGEVESRNVTTTKAGATGELSTQAGNVSTTGGSESLGSNLSNTISSGSQQNQNQNQTTGQTTKDTTNTTQGESTTHASDKATGHDSGTGGLLSSGGSSAGGILGGGASLLGATVICTQLHTAGILSDKLYHASSIHGKTLPRAMITGYHFWAIPYVRIMRRKDWIGRFAVRAFTAFTIGRAEHISGKKNGWGYLSDFIVQPFCYLLGLLVIAFRKQKDWRTLYTTASPQLQLPLEK